MSGKETTMKAMFQVMAVLAVVGLAGMVLAQDKAPATVKGTVVKVDKTDLTIKTGKGDTAKEVVVKTDDKTVVTIDGEKKTVADLKADMRVTVTPAEGLATSIEAKTPKAKKGA
jgi:hypothetical protein